MDSEPPPTSNGSKLIAAIAALTHLGIAPSACWESEPPGVAGCNPVTAADASTAKQEQKVHIR